MILSKDSRIFQGVLYPDSESYVCQDVLSRLSSVFVEWAYILHDCDTDENGVVKKPHYHWIGKLENPALLSTVAGARKLCVPDNSVEFCRSWKYSVRYLIHKDQPDKFQYTSDSIKCNFSLSSALRDKDDEVGKVRLIRDYLIDTRCTSASVLMDWCIENNCWSEFRRSFSIWACVMRENKEAL